MCFGNRDLGIDLGTANTLIYVKDKGIVLNEPSVIAVDTVLKEVIAVGHKAKEMIGKAPGNIMVVRPLKDGVISDFAMTAEMLRRFLGQVMEIGGIFTKTRIAIGVPSGVTEVEKRSVEEVVRQMGAKEVYIMDEPITAALGCEIDVNSSTGSMVADIGGGTSDIAIIALGGIVTSTSLRYAGDKLNETIIAYIRKQYSLIIGEQTAEDIKKEVGCAFIDEENAGTVFDASGRDAVSGLPKTVKVTIEEMHDALDESISIIIDGIKTTLENTPPEIASDIVNNGLVLTGGGALIKGIDKLIKQETGMDVTVAENPLEAVAQGTGKSLDNIGALRRYASERIKR